MQEIIKIFAKQGIFNCWPRQFGGRAVFCASREKAEFRLSNKTTSPVFQKINGELSAIGFSLGVCALRDKSK